MHNKNGRVVMNRSVLLASLLFSTLAAAQPPVVESIVVNSALEPVPVNIVPVAEQFTIPPKQLTAVLAGASVAPDPSGTRYAITSITVSNPTDQPATLVTRSVAVEGVGADGCTFVFNGQDTTDGPEVEVPAHDTVHIAFAQPFVTAPVTGANVCFVAGGDGYVGVKWSAVGYKILP
jgi:hypothetical protein